MFVGLGWKNTGDVDVFASERFRDHARIRKYTEFLIRAVSNEARESPKVFKDSDSMTQRTRFPPTPYQAIVGTTPS